MPISEKNCNAIYKHYESNCIINKEGYYCDKGIEECQKEFNYSVNTIKCSVRAVRLKLKKGETIEDVKRLPNILLLDIETAPLKGYMFNVWKTNIRQEQIEEDWFMLTWAAKWLCTPGYFGDKVTPEESINLDDKRICKSLWDKMNAADIIIAHNAKKFDIKRINTRLLINGFMRPSPYQVIDTLLELRKLFAFSHNRLDAVNMVLGNQRKIPNDGMPLWIACKNGDAEALDTMYEYNEGDIGALEDLYMTFRGWITSHPNLNLYAEGEEMRCHVCLSENLDAEDEYATAASTFRTVRCKDCGGISRVRTSGLTIEKRRNLLMSCAR